LSQSLIMPPALSLSCLQHHSSNNSIIKHPRRLHLPPSSHLLTLNQNSKQQHRDAPIHTDPVVFTSSSTTVPSLFHSCIHCSKGLTISSTNNQAASVPPITRISVSGTLSYQFHSCDDLRLLNQDTRERNPAPAPVLVTFPLI
jgi:hypothetical protein